MQEIGKNRFFSFRKQFDIPVRKIADKPGDRITLRNTAYRVAESNTLNPPGKKNMHLFGLLLRNHEGFIAQLR